ncbi:Adipocyte plasma membrane-associated protein [Sarcoptes scabiei]|uniref:Adipocyte plasma membrane-associated protein n=2 Tax=Sarcoptes scabiei TaxID=52283 RepID=A0A834VE53_SARSC|nr:Adipocyte plasma membrane-associated protein [Sarcoptes scabiei]UXI22569.1 beta-galactosidase-1-like protein 2 [Sarcoptes scabiei]
MMCEFVQKVLFFIFFLYIPIDCGMQSSGRPQSLQSSHATPSSASSLNNPLFGGISPLVLQKYNLSPASSIVGTNVGSSAEQLFNYVPAPSSISLQDPMAKMDSQLSPQSASSISPLPIMTAFKTLSSQTNPAFMTAAQAALPLSIADIPVTYKFDLPDSFSGALEPNNLLAGATRMFEGQIVGPTSLAIYKDFIYAGTAGGAVWRGNLRTGNATRIAKINNEMCEKKTWDSSLCGRPLGVRVDRQGVLYFVDAYLGLHSIHFDQDDRVQLTPLLSVEQVGGKYMGHLVLDEGAGTNGGHMIYITVASAKRDLTQWTSMVIEPDTSGFVVQYDTGSGSSQIIWDKLWYPTSIEITDDRTALLVAEFSSRKVLKYYIRGLKKGTSEVWVENLPGESDHLIRSADKTKETYWMPIVNARNQSKPNLLDFMSDKPYLRKELLDLYQKIGTRIEQLGQEYQSEQLERLGFTMKTGLQFYQQNIANNYGLILELDAQGNILGSLHSVAGVNSFISEALEGESDSPNERVLYIGSFGYPYILKLIIRKPAVDVAQRLASSATGQAQTIVSINDPSTIRMIQQRSQYSPVLAISNMASTSSVPGITSIGMISPLLMSMNASSISPQWSQLMSSSSAPFSVRHRF